MQENFVLLALFSFLLPFQAHCATGRVAVGSSYECNVAAGGNSLHKSGESGVLSFKTEKRKLTRLITRYSAKPSKNRTRIRRLRSTLTDMKACERGRGKYRWTTPTPVPTGGAIIADHTVIAAYGSIPQSVKDSIRSDFRIYYGHTSHGSQIITGLKVLSENSSPAVLDIFHEEYGDLGHSGDLAWEEQTRNWLRDHPSTDVVMWSWCGGVSDNTPAGINAYLSAMSNLESDFPGVKFIYMTGHLDGSGEDGNLREMNRLMHPTGRYFSISRILKATIRMAFITPAARMPANGAAAGVIHIPVLRHAE